MVGAGRSCTPRPVLVLGAPPHVAMCTVPHPFELCRAYTDTPAADPAPWPLPARFPWLALEDPLRLSLSRTGSTGSTLRKLCVRFSVRYCKQQLRIGADPSAVGVPSAPGAHAPWPLHQLTRVHHCCHASMLIRFARWRLFGVLQWSTSVRFLHLESRAPYCTTAWSYQQSGTTFGTHAPRTNGNTWRISTPTQYSVLKDAHLRCRYAT